MTSSQPRIGAIILVRYQSERLPGKALLELGGKPVLEHLLDRVVASRFLEKQSVVVCTTDKTSDDVIAKFAQGYGCSVFRGSQDDLVFRLYAAVSRYSFDAVILADGDDPLCATEYMDLTMEHLLTTPGVGAVSCEGLPLGVASKSFSRGAVDLVYDRYETEENDTGYTRFFTDCALVQHETVGPLTDRHVLDQARLTLDYEEDLELFDAVFSHFSSWNKLPNLEEVLNFLRLNPDILALNQSRVVEYWNRFHEKSVLTWRDENGNIHSF